MNTWVKKSYILMLALVLVTVLTACGEYSNKTKPSSANNTTGSTSSANETKTEDTTDQKDTDHSADNSANNSTSSKESSTDAEVVKPTAMNNEELNLLDFSQHPIVTMELSNGGTIKLELFPELAPNTVANFVSLVEQGFYDSLIFHRVIQDFMIQGGDPQGTGMGNPGYSIAGEFKSNKFNNPLKHTRGVISMARSQLLPNSAGSQFFIMHADAPHLDGDYAAFGIVIEGLDVLDEVAAQKVDRSDRPADPISMTKVTVDLQQAKLQELVTE